MGTMQIVTLIAVGLLLFFLFWVVVLAGLEFAFFGANQLTIELKRKQGSASGLLLGKIFEQSERFWAATTIGFYVCLIAFVIAFHIISSYLMQFLPEVLRDFEYTQLIIDWILISAIIVSSISFFSKKIFESHPESSLQFWMRPLNMFMKFSTPVANFYTRFSEVILKYLFNIRVPKKQVIFERADAEVFERNVLNGQHDEENLNKELFEKVIQLSHVKVRKCLIPRNEVLAIDINSAPSQLRDAFVKSKQSKIVIFENDIDHVIGYVHHIELGKQPKSIREIMHSIPAVPETMHAIDLIHLFTKERKSIAWVIDEFGGTAGVVTMEDILKEIFGDIGEEFDIQEYMESQVSENEFIFSGRLKLDYIHGKYGIEFDDDNSETLSGYIIKHYTTIPKQQTKIIIDKIEFEILMASPTKVETVKLKILQS